MVKRRPHGRILTVAALGAALSAALAGAVLFAPSQVEAVAAAPFPFEIDGNLVSNGRDDWVSVLPLDGGDETFVADLAGANGKELTAWDGSNKDIDLISTWEYKSAKVVPDKDNITNAYAKAYEVDHDSNPTTQKHLVIYFGADRFANNGDAALGFWFFQNDVGIAADGAFRGEHAVGDVLVQVDFVRGGSSSEIQIFKWVGAGGSHGALDEIAFAAANGFTVCDDDDGDGIDDSCATTNDAPRPAPWPYTPKSGPAGTFPAESFFEGGIDVTALIGEVCFSAFMAETRSSHSETAELKDFALGDFDLCSVALAKRCEAITDESPIYDPDTETFLTLHTVTITNDGFGTIHDIALRDDAVGTEASCDIVSIDGEDVGPTAFPDNETWIEIAEELAPAGEIDVGLACVSTQNPFSNSASVRASASPGGDGGITDSADEGSEDATRCQLQLNPNLNVLKFCASDGGSGDDLNPLFEPGDLGITLQPPSFAPEVCVDIVLTNTSSPAQRLVIDSIDDLEGTVPLQQSADLLAAFQDANDANGTTSLDSSTLEPGEQVAFTHCYTPVGPDNGETNPSLVQYSDTVSIDAHGRSAGTLQDITASASCSLCPDCCDDPESSVLNLPSY